jgi:hypothetical protein
MFLSERIWRRTRTRNAEWKVDLTGWSHWPMMVRSQYCNNKAGACKSPGLISSTAGEMDAGHGWCSSRRFLHWAPPREASAILARPRTAAIMVTFIMQAKATRDCVWRRLVNQEIRWWKCGKTGWRSRPMRARYRSVSLVRK